MQKSSIKAIFILAAGLLIFVVTKPKYADNGGMGKLPSIKDLLPIVSPEKLKEFPGGSQGYDAIIVLNSYSLAYNNGESEQGLNRLNEYLLQEMGMKANYNPSTKTVTVMNADGKTVLVNECA